MIKKKYQAALIGSLLFAVGILVFVRNGNIQDSNSLDKVENSVPALIEVKKTVNSSPHKSADQIKIQKPSIKDQKNSEEPHSSLQVSNPEVKPTDFGRFYPIDKLGGNGKEDTNKTKLGWFKSGASPEDYEFNIIPTESNRTMACVSPTTDNPKSFAALHTFVDIESFSGKTAHLSAEIATNDIEIGRSNLFFRADNHDQKPIAFSKAILSQSMIWKRVQLDLKIPQEAYRAFFGITLDGRGRVCIRDILFSKDD